ncbi:FHA domain-containing protein [Planctomycetota bacterium]|nr:FHA domain-containing protein [Planctomycetota bacterium]
MPLWLTSAVFEPFELKEDVDVTLGRGPSCDLSLYSSMLSREHARIRWEGGRPVLFDLGSLNGTFIGPDKVRRHRLAVGDVIRLGNIKITVRTSDSPPNYENPALEETTEEDNFDEVGHLGETTKLFSQTAVLHRKVFQFDELAWLEDNVGFAARAVRLPTLVGEGLGDWYESLPGRSRETLWHLLRIGVIAPTTGNVSFHENTAREVADACKLTRRGEKLKALLEGKHPTWNEMAALRYRVRQLRIFTGLRSAARAYRPGGGLSILSLKQLNYELSSIYATEVSDETRNLELRRLMVLGALAPSEEARGEAWFPEDWGDGSCTIARRGRAMLDGFRLEE